MLPGSPRMGCHMIVTIGRRELLVALGGAAATWPLGARAQQSAMPRVGLINSRSAQDAVRNVAGFRKGLDETGYVEGQNVMVEYHWLEGQYDRLPAVMADRDRNARLPRWCPGGQSCDLDDPNRLRRRRRPGQVGTGRKPCPAKWQCDRRQ